MDDKIELNRRMNATLEAMARAVFKSWFMDFDPVRANMEGKQPSIVMEYTNIALGIRSRIRENNAEIDKLAAIRDYLLPKLISGKIRIPDVEKFVEGV